MRRTIKLFALAALTALVALPAVPAGGRSAEGFHVVRFDDRITPADRAALAATGVEVIDYEPRDSYLVWATTEEVSGAARVEGVRSVAPLPTARKLGPSAVGSELLEVTVRAAATPGVAAMLEAGGQVTRRTRLGSGLVSLTARVGAGMLPRLLAHPAVLYASAGSAGLYTEDEMSAQVVAGNIGPSNRAVPGYAAWLASKGLSGAGVKVAVVDTGVDLHPDLVLRVEKPKDYTSPAEATDTLGHGTHVAGIIGGAPPAGILPRDPDGFVYGQGVAPAVGLVNLNAIGIGGTIGQFNHGQNINVISRDAWLAGARIWNASWHTGEGSRAGYTASTRLTDTSSRNADGQAPGSEEFLMVFSAGNAGNAGPTVPHEAKNIIAVGAMNGGRGLVYPLTGNIDSVASFSSRGPTADGRVFPTVSAPGENIVSARAYTSGIAAACPPPVDGGGLYVSCSGTSMAAPHIAGASALVHQWWLKTHPTPPSPAMVRALLVNTATDTGTKNIPNVNEGWGRVNLGSLFGAAPAVHDDQTRVLRAVGESTSYEVETAGDQPLRITAAWSDAPAAVGANPALVNDLDLVVELLDAEGLPVRTWLGNRFTAGLSVEGGTADRRNNLENVFLATPQAGRYRIRVAAANLPGDGIPENADPIDQDFALVVRGASAL